MQLAERTAEIARLLQERNWRALRELLAYLPPPEGAELLFRLQKPERMLVFRSMPRDLAAEVFTHLEPHDRDALLRDLTDEETRQLLSSLSPDDRTHLLEELPGNVTRRLLNLLSPEDLSVARHLLGYPEESVGRMMTPDYAAVRPDWTAARALEHIRQLGKDTETINVVYVTARGGTLVGQVELRRFILADPATPVDQIMDPNVISLSAHEDREKAVHTVERYDVNVIPVVDSGGVLLGIVTVDDVLDVAEEEVTEDFHKIATVEPIHVPLREAGVGLFYQRRIGWLLVLVFVNVLSGAGIAYYQETIARAITLVFFLPLLIASSGNAGAQSATLMVRGLATGDVQGRDWLRLLGKELVVATAIGLTMAAAVSLLGMYRAGAQVAVVVAVTMVAVVLVGSLIGLCLPLLLNRFGIDPAVASAPLVTSIADIAGVLIYFSFASWYLGLPR